MTQFFGTFEPPEFSQDDLAEIRRRLESTQLDKLAYEGIPKESEEAIKAKTYLSYLCGIVETRFNDDVEDKILPRNEWHRLRSWARKLPDEAQQLKTDLYRLLKAAMVSDGGE